MNPIRARWHILFLSLVLAATGLAACSRDADDATASAPQAPAAGLATTASGEAAASGEYVPPAVAAARRIQAEQNPEPEAAEPEPAAENGPYVPPAVAAAAKRRADPPPSIAVGEPNPSAPDVVDASCRTDADCAIKDVGSCCGYRPACVNKSSPTFPDRVKAACAESGRMGICGFPAITGCACVSGQCEGTGAEASEQVQ